MVFEKKLAPPKLELPDFSGSSKDQDEMSDDDWNQWLDEDMDN